MLDASGGFVNEFLLGALLIAALLALWRGTYRRSDAITRRAALSDEFEELLSLQPNHDGTLEGQCGGRPISLRIDAERDRPRLIIELPLHRHLSTLDLVALTPATTSPEAEDRILTGDDSFDPRFRVRGDVAEALVTLGRETRSALISLLNTRPGAWWDSITAREQTLHASLSLSSRSGAAPRAARMIRELAYCASVLGQTSRTAPFTRLVSEASKPQAPGYRLRCLNHLAQAHSANLSSLRAHPDLGLRFICFETHPEHFRDPHHLRQMLLEVANNHEHPALRDRALGHLDGLLGEEIIEDDDQPLVTRLEALSATSARGDQRAFAALAERMLARALPSERLAITRRLQRLDWAGLPALLKTYASFQDLGPIDVETLLEMAPNLGDDDRREILIDLLHAPSDLARANTARALSRSGGSRTLALLRQTRASCPPEDNPRILAALDEAIDHLEDRLAQGIF